MKKFERIAMHTLLGTLFLGLIVPVYSQSTQVAPLWEQFRSQTISIEHFAIALVVQFGSIKGAVSGGLFGLSHACYQRGACQSDHGDNNR